MRARPWHRFWIATFVLSCSFGTSGSSESSGSSGGCGSGAAPSDDCASVRGTCTFGACETGSHESGNACFLGACCLPGATCDDNGGRCVYGACGPQGGLSGVCSNGMTCCRREPTRAPEAGPESGTCDSRPCAAGCACVPTANGGVCDCAGDDPGVDATRDAAGDGEAGDGETGAAVDGATVDGAPGDADADASNASGDAEATRSEACGLITCEGACFCVDVGKSWCECP